MLCRKNIVYSIVMLYLKTSSITLIMFFYNVILYVLWKNIYYVINAILLWTSNISHLLICQLVKFHQCHKITNFQSIQFDESQNLVNCSIEPMDKWKSGRMAEWPNQLPTQTPIGTQSELVQTSQWVGRSWFRLLRRYVNLFQMTM